MIYTTKRFSVGVEKEFSAAGREWAGIKGGMKGALKGATWGAILAPGNLIAAGLGHPKTALGITAAGSVIGGGIGFAHGRRSGIDEYKFKTDPEYQKKVEKEETERYQKELKNLEKEDIAIASEFNVQSWKKLSDKLNLPPEILKYIKFYESWRKNIHLWYSNATPWKSENRKDHWPVEFKEYFPIPLSAYMVEDWYKHYKEYRDNEKDIELEFLTVNSAGDDGFIEYSFKDKSFWGYNSLKIALQENIKMIEGFEHKYELSETQKKLVEKFLRSI